MTTLIALRHDQDWGGALVILAVAVALALLTLAYEWCAAGPDSLGDARYDDRIQAPYPPRPTDSSTAGKR